MSFAWCRRWSLHNISRRKPLMLKIETTNTCNARCCFCAYEQTKRQRSVLSLELFDKSLAGYSEIGGGPVTLTPVVGDVLLDPYLLQRLDRLAAFPAITDVSFTTNLIAHERLSDSDWAAVLRRLRYLQISLGGYDAQTYARMFGVDTFNVVWSGIHRIAAIRRRIGDGTRLSISLRAPDIAILMQHEKTQLLREMGYDHISGISSFGNWCGDVKDGEMPSQTIINPPRQKADCCFIPAMFMAVLSDGRVTGCSCVDHNGVLEIGNLNNEPLGKIWRGTLRRDLCRSFRGSNLKALCVNCSSYTSLQSMLGMPFCEGVSAKHVSMAFYDDFGGG